MGRNTKRTGMVSGFSKNLMKLFLDDSGDIAPEGVMELAIIASCMRHLSWWINLINLSPF